MRTGSRILIGTALAMVALPAIAAPDARATDAADFFVAMCVAHPNDAERAHQLLDGQPETARPMSEAELQALGPQTGGGAAWVLKTPRDAWVVVDYEPLARSCRVSVKEADPRAMREALALALTNFMASLGKTIESKPDIRETVDGVGTVRVGWEIPMGSAHEVTVIATFADAPVHNRQHLMSFTVLK